MLINRYAKYPLVSVTLVRSFLYLEWEELVKISAANNAQWIVENDIEIQKKIFFWYWKLIRNIYMRPMEEYAEKIVALNTLDLVSRQISIFLEDSVAIVYYWHAA